MQITVIHRRFRYKSRTDKGFELVITREYKRVLKLIHKAMDQNKEISFSHSIINKDGKWYDGSPYDQIKVKINEP